MNSCTETVETVALQVQSQCFKKEYKRFERKKGHCTYCGQKGHVRDNCFRLAEYPEWYKGKKYTRGSQQQLKPYVSKENNRHAAYLVETPFEENSA